jgi:hypothetical protein
VLEKTYLMLPEDDGVLEKAEGTKIDWKAGAVLYLVLPFFYCEEVPKKQRAVQTKPDACSTIG